LLRPKLLLISVIASVLVGSTLAFSSFYANANDNNEKVVSGHGLGYYPTTGEVIDPTGSGGSANTCIDPTKYLRSFSYGRVSMLEDGTVLWEYTIIADDRQMMEI
jgi:hypothetical protein